MAAGFAIRYYRNEEWSMRWAAIGVHKPPGWVLSTHPYPTQKAAQVLVDHINRQGPDHPCELVVTHNGVERG